MTGIRITRDGPLLSVQDHGRFGALRYGISASGPMDRSAFARAGRSIGTAAGTAGLEFGSAGFGFRVAGGPLGVGMDGGDFILSHNGIRITWPAYLTLRDGDVIEIAPGAWGNYGYVRFDLHMDIPPVMGSRSTNHVVGLGGLEGRCLTLGDIISFSFPTSGRRGGETPSVAARAEGPIRVLWGLHAELFAPSTRRRFAGEAFVVSGRLDRMGARLLDPGGIFTDPPRLSLVSDAVVPGDVQILGDGTPVVLLRDHQPTGGYPRIATVISADLDRFAQVRPGSEVRFESVSLAHAHMLLRAGEA